MAARRTVKRQAAWRADGSTRATGHFPVSSYRYADVLSGTWGIADSAVVTLVSYVYANGQWYIQAMELWSINVAQSWVGKGGSLVHGRGH